ncbi:hypothetical protein J1614_003158 [Plenodomus biglobosus]|nr:hypothetical protein J1614_003158 [Plenodomus biglobosus]
MDIDVTNFSDMEGDSPSSPTEKAIATKPLTSAEPTEILAVTDDDTRLDGLEHELKTAQARIARVEADLQLATEKGKKEKTMAEEAQAKLQMYKDKYRPALGSILGLAKRYPVEGLAPDEAAFPSAEDNKWYRYINSRMKALARLEALLHHENPMDDAQAALSNILCDRQDYRAQVARLRTEQTNRIPIGKVADLVEKILWENHNTEVQISSTLAVVADFVGRFTQGVMSPMSIPAEVVAISNSLSSFSQDSSIWSVESILGKFCQGHTLNWYHAYRAVVMHGPESTHFLRHTDSSVQQLIAKATELNKASGSGTPRTYRSLLYALAKDTKIDPTATGSGVFSFRVPESSGRTFQGHIAILLSNSDAEYSYDNTEGILHFSHAGSMVLHPHQSSTTPSEYMYRKRGLALQIKHQNDTEETEDRWSG